MKVRHGERWTFTRVHNAILESDRSTIEKAVYWALCYFADQNGFCFPSYSTIAKMASCSKRSAIAAMETLTKEGWVTKDTRRTETGDQTSNGYLVHANPEGGVQELHHPSAGDAPPPVQELHPNENHTLNENQVNSEESICGGIEEAGEEEADITAVLDAYNRLIPDRTTRRSSTVSYRILAQKLLDANHSLDTIAEVFAYIAKSWPEHPTLKYKIKPDVILSQETFEKTLNWLIRAKIDEEKKKSPTDSLQHSSQFSFTGEAI